MDRVVALSESKVTTEKRVNSEEPFFKGHYPGNPVMPGVLICEAIFQSGAILSSKIIKSSDKSEKEFKGVPVLTRIKDVKFKKIVRPDDLLQIEVELVEKVGEAFFMRGVARVNEKVAVRTEFAVMLAEETAIT